MLDKREKANGIILNKIENKSPVMTLAYRTVFMITAVAVLLSIQIPCENFGTCESS